MSDHKPVTDAEAAAMLNAMGHFVDIGVGSIEEPVLSNDIARRFLRDREAMLEIVKASAANSWCGCDLAPPNICAPCKARALLAAVKGE